MPLCYLNRIALASLAASARAWDNETDESCRSRHLPQLAGCAAEGLVSGSRILRYNFDYRANRVLNSWFPSYPSKKIRFASWIYWSVPGRLRLQDSTTDGTTDPMGCV